MCPHSSQNSRVLSIDVLKNHPDKHFLFIKLRHNLASGNQIWRNQECKRILELMAFVRPELEVYAMHSGDLCHDAVMEL